MAMFVVGEGLSGPSTLPVCRVASDLAGVPGGRVGSASLCTPSPWRPLRMGVLLKYVF